MPTPIRISRRRNPKRDRAAALATPRNPGGFRAGEIQTRPRSGPGNTKEPRRISRRRNPTRPRSGPGNTKEPRRISRQRNPNATAQRPWQHQGTQADFAPAKSKRDRVAALATPRIPGGFRASEIQTRPHHKPFSDDKHDFAKRNRNRPRSGRLARPEGLEPSTAGLEGRCSVQLSYGRFDRPSPSGNAGRGREIRTPDILLPKQVRYQTAPYPETRRRDHTRRGGTPSTAAKCMPSPS